MSAYLLTRKKRVRAKEKRQKRTDPKHKPRRKWTRANSFARLRVSSVCKGSNARRTSRRFDLRKPFNIPEPGTDIVELTEVYLEARYGDRTVSKEDYLSKVSGINTAGEVGR